MGLKLVRCYLRGGGSGKGWVDCGVSERLWRLRDGERTPCLAGGRSGGYGVPSATLRAGSSTSFGFRLTPLRMTELFLCVQSDDLLG